MCINYLNYFSICIVLSLLDYVDYCVHYLQICDQKRKLCCLWMILAFELTFLTMAILELSFANFLSAPMLFLRYLFSNHVLERDLSDIQKIPPIMLSTNLQKHYHQYFVLKRMLTVLYILSLISSDTHLNNNV